VIALQQERERAGWSKLRLSQEARVAPSVVGGAESGRRRPYEPELRRIADALCWTGEPGALLQDVSGDAQD